MSCQEHIEESEAAALGRGSSSPESFEVEGQRGETPDARETPQIDLTESLLRLVFGSNEREEKYEELYRGLDQLGEKFKSKITVISQNQKKIYHKMLSIQVLTADIVKSQEMHTSLIYTARNAEKCTELKSLNLDTIKTAKDIQDLRSRAVEAEARLDDAFKSLVSKYKK